MLKVDGLEKFEGTQVHYRVRNPADFAGKNLVVVGGGVHGKGGAGLVGPKLGAGTIDRFVGAVTGVEDVVVKTGRGKAGRLDCAVDQVLVVGIGGAAATSRVVIAV
jgi:hypothetical protein